MLEHRFFNKLLDTATPAGRMVFTVLGAVAELERSLVAERVRAGLRNAKAKGKQLGRPRSIVDVAQVRLLRAQGRSWRAISRELHVAAETAQNALNPLKIIPAQHVEHADIRRKR